MGCISYIVSGKSFEVCLDPCPPGRIGAGNCQHRRRNRCADGLHDVKERAEMGKATSGVLTSGKLGGRISGGVGSISSAKRITSTNRKLRIHRSSPGGTWHENHISRQIGHPNCSRARMYPSAIITFRCVCKGNSKRKVPETLLANVRLDESVLVFLHRS